MADTGKRALITGITGQDGSYLSELLLEKGYEVHGIIRRSSSFNTSRLDHVYQDPHERGARLFLHYGDLTDANNLASILRKVRPTEVYNLGAQSHVRVSFDMPIHTVGCIWSISCTWMADGVLAPELAQGGGHEHRIVFWVPEPGNLRIF